MSIDNEKLLIICGPTGVGKTSLAVKLANKFGGEIVSADSRQVYRKLDVITAKDTDTGVQRKLPWKEEDVPYCWEIDGVPTYLLDVVDPDKEFSVAIYERLAQRAIEFITSRGKLPIIAGGTGLYIKAIVDALNEAEKIKGKPTMIIAHTVKGKGVSFMENKVEYHGVAPTRDEYERAMKELGAN